jgi:putative peptidoglycan lipid II flippase
MRAYQAMQNTRVMFVTYCIENGLNIVFGLALYPRFGVQGLAAALSLAYVGGTAVALWDLRRRAGGVDGRAVLRSLVRVVAATAVMAVGVALVSTAIGGDSGARLLLRVLAAVGAGVTLYAVAARAFGVAELETLLPTRRSPA